MNRPPARLDSALKRLAAALDQLEAAEERRSHAHAERNNLEEEIAILQDDRAVARSQSLELANSEVSRRLQKASSTIRAVLSRGELDNH